MRVSTLLTWDAGALSTEANAVRALQRSVQAALEQLISRTGPVLFSDGHWTGAASDAAQQALQERIASGRALLTVLTDTAAALSQFAVTLADARSRLSSALAAAAPDLTVHDDGTVDIVPLVAPGPAYDDAGRQIPNPSPNQPVWTVVERGRIAALVEGALYDARVADERCANALADLETTVDAALARFAPAALRQLNQDEMPAFLWVQWQLTIPPPGSDPDSVAEWWACADEQTRERLLREHPEQLGNLAGVPPEARNRANRLALDAGLARTRAEIAALVELVRSGDEELMPALRRLDELQQRLGYYESVQRGLHFAETKIDPRTRQVQRPVQLLILDPDAFSGRGRAALAVGDLATADHVAYVVPGLQQWVDPEFYRTVSNAFNLHTAAGSRNTGRSMATVAWIGYDAPGFGEVGLESRARHGADRLADELRGLRAVRRVNDPHLTVVGHSYGSTTAGLTARRHGDLGIDDLVLVGSPGAGTSNIAALQVPAGHVWIGSASGDVVTHLAHFGNDPAANDFGFRFRAETELRKSYPNQAEHSDYFAPRGESLMNVSRIMAGVYGEVDEAADRIYLAVPGLAGEVRHDPENRRAVTEQPTHTLDAPRPHP